MLKGVLLPGVKKSILAYLSIDWLLVFSFYRLAIALTFVRSLFMKTYTKSKFNID